MRTPITREEQQRTPREVLARHLTPIHPPLSDAERDELLDAGLVYEDEMKPREPSGSADPRDTRWDYVGGRWGVDYRCGRPVLVPGCDGPKPPLTALQEVERRFAGAVLLVELVTRGYMSDQTVADLRREPPWSLDFEDAERADAERLASQHQA